MVKFPMLAGFSALIPVLMIVAVILIVVAVSKAKKKHSQNTPTMTPPAGICRQCGRPLVMGAAFCAACGATVGYSTPTQEARDKAEIAALSLEEVQRRYCDVTGRSDEYRYLCYEELERRKGNKQ